MDPIQLSAEQRTDFGKGTARQLRRAGKIPAIAYRNGDEPIHIALDTKSFVLQMDRTGRNTVFQLTVGDDQHYVLLQQMQRHPVTRNPMHVDFRIVNLDDVVNVMVNINFTGRSLGVRMGGRLLKVRRYLRLKAPVTAIPNEIVVDMTELPGGSTFYSGDVTTIPENCVLADNKRVPLLTIKGGTVDRNAEK